ncbi:MAG: hypothetical protein WC043_06125 [Pseudobdellovibrionaceae bacterium]
MECTVIHKNVRAVLEDGGLAYTTMIEAGGAHNVDYASYCCHVSLNRLRQCLGRPDMSVDQLEGLLRRASRKYDADDTSKDWAMVMARFLTRHANANDHSAV